MAITISDNQILRDGVVVGDYLRRGPIGSKRAYLGRVERRNAYGRRTFHDRVFGASSVADVVAQATKILNERH